MEVLRPHLCSALGHRKFELAPCIWNPDDTVGILWQIGWQSGDNTHSAGQGCVVTAERMSVNVMLVPFWPIAAVQRVENCVFPCALGRIK